MRLLYEVAITSIILFFFPSLSLSSFLFITPVITLVLHKRGAYALWAALFFAIVQESIPFPASLSSGSLFLPFVAAVAIYITSSIAKRISCGPLMISSLLIILLAMSCTFCAFWSSYRSSVFINPFSFFAKAIGYTLAIHSINILSFRLLTSLFQFLWRRRA
ncbi:MAG: hypothetical protein QRY74_06165 [Chlamydia sp.]